MECQKLSIIFILSDVLLHFHHDFLKTSNSIFATYENPENDDQ